jgi:hypothetical protein
VISDIAGQGDGSVAIWEWGHVGVVCQPRSPGTYAKVNRLRFNSQGNKFGAADGDGHVALWTLRLGGGSAPHRPFFVRILFILLDFLICVLIFLNHLTVTSMSQQGYIRFCVSGVIEYFGHNRSQFRVPQRRFMGHPNAPTQSNYSL